jgi:hypothetical protein
MGGVGSGIPLALAVIVIHIRRTFCGDYGVYSPTGWLARFQMGRS